MAARSDADIYDPSYVKEIFDRCSAKYIWFSSVCSMGFTQIWRRQCVEQLHSPPDQAVGYDLMAGTGEAWPYLLRRHPSISEIRAVDISSGMHKRALERLHRMRQHRISFVEADVLASALPPASADFVIATFGLKTFNKDQLRALAKTTAMALKPGGTFAFIEASDPKDWWLRPLYLFHLKKVLPLIERLFLRGAQDFAMIGTYSTNFGDARAFCGMLEDEGLDVSFKKHFFGCATSASGRKPE